MTLDLADGPVILTGGPVRQIRTVPAPSATVRPSTAPRPSTTHGVDPVRLAAIRHGLRVWTSVD